MQAKYLLYIDILGFSEMVKSDPGKIADLYRIIDTLAVHRHDAFKTIAFSDTVIVYNTAEPTSGHDHAYLVMYSCEFVQDLLYRTIRKQIHFRALLRYGEFEHSRLRNIECFYGTGLIDSYMKEKEVACTGLFIHRSCHRYNLIFPTAKYDDELSFVYLNQSLEQLQFICQGSQFPVDQYYLRETDELWRLVWDVKYLENIYSLMTTHHDPKVRAKFLAAWQFYRSRYSDLLHEFEQHSFDVRVVCPSYNWDRKLDQFNAE